MRCELLLCVVDIDAMRFDREDMRFDRGYETRTERMGILLEFGKATLIYVSHPSCQFIGHFISSYLTSIPPTNFIPCPSTPSHPRHERVNKRPKSL